MARRLGDLDPTRPPWRWLLRLPQHLYRANLGWLLGGRFLQLTTRGRKSGGPRRVVLEVIGRDETGGGWVIASAWGPRAQWLRNLEASPEAEVRVGARRFAARAERLSERDGAARLAAYARRHPWAYRLFIGPLLLGRRARGGDDEVVELARAIPIVIVRPRNAGPSERVRD